MRVRFEATVYCDRECGASCTAIVQFADGWGRTALRVVRFKGAPPGWLAGVGDGHAVALCPAHPIEHPTLHLQSLVRSEA